MDPPILPGAFAFDPLLMATHSTTLAWKIPWTEEPGGLQSMGWQRVGHDWSNLSCMHACYKRLANMILKAEKAEIFRQKTWDSGVLRPGWWNSVQDILQG